MMLKTKKVFFLLVLMQREKKGRVTLSLWINSAMTTYDRAAFIYFWKKDEVLNKQKYDKEKRKLINVHFEFLKFDREKDLSFRKQTKGIDKRSLKPKVVKVLGAKVAL